MSSVNVILPITEKLIEMLSVNIKEMDIKEIDDVYKNMKKELKEMKKEAVKKAKEDVKEAKKKNKEAVKKNIKHDENGEEIVRVLSKYQIFVRDIKPRIMDMYPEIPYKELMGKINLEWNKHKAIIARIHNRKDEEDNDVEVKKEASVKKETNVKKEAEDNEDTDDVPYHESSSDTEYEDVEDVAIKKE
jgi:hypothetical protein